MAAPVRARSAAARPQPARGTRPVTRTAPARPAPARPRLRVVNDARVHAAGRQRRVRAVLMLAAVLVAGCMFALAAFNAVLVSGQGRVDALEKQVAEAQAQYSANRLRVAELEAPGHVVAVAQQRLGMVPPPRVTYLTPSETMADEVGPGSGSKQPATSSDNGTSWAAVKPYLGSRP